MEPSELLGLVRNFVDHAQKSLASVMPKVKNHNLKAITEELHSLKGASSQIGAIHFHDIVAILERQLKRFDDYGQLDEIEAICIPAFKQLDEFLNIYNDLCIHTDPSSLDLTTA